jgi:hypothetical protein
MCETTSERRRRAKHFSTTNEGDAAARTLGLGRHAVAKNRGWSRGQGPTEGGAGGEKRGSRAAAHGGGGGGAAEAVAVWARQRWRVAVKLRAGRWSCGSPERKETQGAAVVFGKRLRQAFRRARARRRRICEEETARMRKREERERLYEGLDPLVTR